MRHGEWLSETQLDYLEEMMNVGAGHAADVLSQMLRAGIKMTIPVVHAVPATETASVIGDPTRLFACARMELFGDTRGAMYFMMADDQKEIFLRLIAQSAPDQATGAASGGEAGTAQSIPVDLSVIAEVGSIIAGTYLSAIQRFCSLSIAHSVPAMAIDMYQALLDEDLVSVRQADWKALVIENVFHVGNRTSSSVEQVRTYLLMIPYPESIDRLAASIDEARRRASGA